jgi:hypothetical protein
MARVSRRWSVAGAVVAVAAGLVSGEAKAFTVHPSASGEAARWQASEIEFVVDDSYLDLGPQALEAFEASIEAWSNISGAYAPKITFRRGKVDPIGYRPGEDNLNTLRFLPKGYAPAGEGLMITVLSYDEFGAIVDADLVVNGGPKRPFGFVVEESPAGSGSDGDVGGDKPRFFDVQNVLTHELGHVFGLDEEEDLPEATMFPSSLKGETKKRDLEADDEAGIRFLYAEPPPSGVASSACSVAQPGASTSANARARNGMQGSGPWAWLSVGLLGSVLLKRRWRRS